MLQRRTALVGRLDQRGVQQVAQRSCRPASNGQQVESTSSWPPLSGSGSARRSARSSCGRRDSAPSGRRGA